MGGLEWPSKLPNVIWPRRPVCLQKLSSWHWTKWKRLEGKALELLTPPQDSPQPTALHLRPVGPWIGPSLCRGLECPGGKTADHLLVPHSVVNRSYKPQVWGEGVGTVSPRHQTSATCWGRGEMHRNQTYRRTQVLREISYASYKTSLSLF